MNTERTPEQIAAERYPHEYSGHLRAAWQEGLQVGAEFAEWCSAKSWAYMEYADRPHWHNRLSYSKRTTQQLISIFLNEKYGK
jgi:hypothetical protein